MYRSTDGSTWTRLPVAPSSPVQAALQTGSGACAAVDGRIVYVGDAPGMVGVSSTVSSSDGVNWNFEPHSPLGLTSLTPQGVALDGRVYVTSGSGSSQRSVVRSIP